MTFHELISKYPWGVIQDKILMLYPDEEKSIIGYEQAYTELRNTIPTSSDVLIYIETVITDGDMGDGRYESVYTIEIGKDDHFALDFVPWSEVLAMLVDDDVFSKYTELEAIAHILYEITFSGYTSAAVEAKGAKLRQSVDAILHPLEE